MTVMLQSMVSEIVGNYLETEEQQHELHITCIFTTHNFKFQSLKGDYYPKGRLLAPQMGV